MRISITGAVAALLACTGMAMAAPAAAPRLDPNADQIHVLHRRGFHRFDADQREVQDGVHCRRQGDARAAGQIRRQGRRHLEALARTASAPPGRARSPVASASCRTATNKWSVMKGTALGRGVDQGVLTELCRHLRVHRQIADRRALARQRVRRDPSDSAASRTASSAHRASAAARPGPRRSRRSRGSLPAPSASRARRRARRGCRPPRRPERCRAAAARETGSGRSDWACPSAARSCARMVVSVPSNVPTAAVTSGLLAKKQASDTR